MPVHLPPGVELLQVGEFADVDLGGQLPADGRAEVLIDAQRPTGQRPLSLVRRSATLPEQHAQNAVPDLEHHGKYLVTSVNAP
jgi:hypothetical protein